MDRFVPIEKKSKKEQKKFHAMQRRTWNGLNPVTRTVPNGKGYDRNKLKDNERKNSRESTDETTCCFNNEDPLEIERKFLIRYPDLNLLDRICTEKTAIVQTYLISEKGISRRIRKKEQGGRIEYWYNEKTKISDMTRIEREREISEEEYNELLKEALPDADTINKIRYCIPSGDHCFEIDVFREWDDRAFAEVELSDEDQEYVFPECLELIKEVTDDGRYTNKSLAINGFVYDMI